MTDQSLSAYDFMAKYLPSSFDSPQRKTYRNGTLIASTTTTTTLLFPTSTQNFQQRRTYRP
jgi:hypothetical protein